MHECGESTARPLPEQANWAVGLEPLPDQAHGAFGGQLCLAQGALGAAGEVRCVGRWLGRKAGQTALALSPRVQLGIARFEHDRFGVHAFRLLVLTRGRAGGG